MIPHLGAAGALRRLNDEYAAMLERGSAQP